MDPLRRLARQARRVYIAERTDYERRLHGPSHRYTLPKRYDGRAAMETTDGLVLDPAVPPVWDSLARFFHENNIDPVAYIATQFLVIERSMKPPEPSGLLSAASRRAWDKVVARKDAELALALEIQQSIAASAIAFNQAAGAEKELSFEIALLNTSLELTPLFRYCLAVSIGGLRFRRIAKRFETEACVQYQRYREHYKRHWGRLLPVGFDRFSHEVYQDTLSGG